MIKELLWIGLGGMIGSISRYGLTLGLVQYKLNFPVSTFLANLIGSFAIGVLAACAMKLPMGWRLLLIPGFCGGFTTFSAFSLENLKLFQSGQSLLALGYILTSVIGGLIFVAVGFTLTQRIIAWQ